jgi:hypothetical protein
MHREALEEANLNKIKGKKIRCHGPKITKLCRNLHYLHKVQVYEYVLEPLLAMSHVYKY